MRRTTKGFPRDARARSLRPAACRGTHADRSKTSLCVLLPDCPRGAAPGTARPRRRQAALRLRHSTPNRNTTAAMPAIDQREAGSSTCNQRRFMFVTSPFSDLDDRRPAVAAACQTARRSNRARHRHGSSVHGQPGRQPGAVWAAGAAGALLARPVRLSGTSAAVPAIHANCAAPRTTSLAPLRAVASARRESF